MFILDYFKAFKAIGKVKEEINNMEKAKSGVATSEFWLGILGMLVTVGSAAVPFIPASALAWIAGVSAVVPSVYAIMRTIAKQTTTTKDDEFLAKLVEKLAPVIKLEVKE